MHKRYLLYGYLLLVQIIALSMSSSSQSGNVFQKGVVVEFILYLKSNPEINKAVWHLRRIIRCKQANLFSQQVVESRDAFGDTLLHALARIGHSELFATGLQLGINPDIKNGEHKTVYDLLEQQVAIRELGSDSSTRDEYARCLDFYQTTYQTKSTSDKLS